MAKRPKLPKDQQASIPQVERFEGGTIKSDLRDLILPPLDFPPRDRTADYADRMNSIGVSYLMASGSEEIISDDIANRRFFAIDTKKGGHVGFMIDKGTEHERVSAQSMLEQVMEAAAAHWGPGVELEVVEMDGHAGYRIQPKHNVIQGSQDPENAKIEKLIREQREAYMREHRVYPSLRQLYYELVRLDKWMNNEKSYAYLAEWCAKLGLTGSPTGRTATVRPVGEPIVMVGGLYPYQQQMLERIMRDTPIVLDIDSDYTGFKDRYVKRTDWSRPYQYSGKMGDYLNQMHATLGHFWFRQTPNHIDDVFNRAERKVQAMQEARLREYCWADVLVTADYASVELRILFTMLDGYPTIPVTHRLTSGYGHESGQGTNITIVYNGASPWPTRRHADMIAGAFVGFGCAPIYAKKAGDSIYGCGEYSCDVTLSKHALDNLKNTMEVLDCKVFIRRPAARYKADMAADIR